MRKALAILALLFTTALVWLLSNPIGGTVPALGPLLEPVHGWADNAEPTDKSWTEDLKIKGLQAPVEVWLEDRLVPHIRAQNDHDLYLVQGYIHARHRLWQMDLQTRAAAGRVSEVIGDKALEFDRGQRRKGMVYAAENSVRAMEAEPRTKAMLDAYTEGVNTFIAQPGQPLPLEYKLMGFRPEQWTNLRTALLMKYMADDLTGYTEDIPLTQLRDALSPDEFNFLYPERIQGSRPAIPEGTKWEAPSMVVPGVPGVPDSLFAHLGRKAEVAAATADDDHSGIGSNAWAIAPQHTADSAAILCNDPHLGLNLPSLWFEVQLTAPGINCYGVSLPGAPGIVIGFNDSISWGLTNNYRDVKDYYEISPADADHYWFNGAKTAYRNRVERIGVKGKPDVVDTVRYTVHGPVQYDAQHPYESNKTAGQTPPPPEGAGGRLLAMQWMAHRATNELLAVWMLNRAQGYDQFVEAIHHFECPAQNMMYADRKGNIAQWGQGRFINKWPGQGRFVMEGKDSLTLWGDDIPMAENPHALNPAQGFLVGANQTNTDNTYPYWYNGTFTEWRSWRIHELLEGLGPRKTVLSRPGEALPDPDGVFDSTAALGMMQMQTDEKSVAMRAFYQRLYPLLDSTQSAAFERLRSNPEEPYFAFTLGADSKRATLLYYWKKRFMEITQNRSLWTEAGLLRPKSERFQEVLEAEFSYQLKGGRDSIDFRRRIERYQTIAVKTFGEALDSLSARQKKPADMDDGRDGRAWALVKNTTLLHLAKIPAFSFYQLRTGGDGTCINAMKERYGPSWRMIVQMGRDSIEAYGVYPGGQSGNPGSLFYSDFIAKWEAGQYWRLMFIPAGVAAKPAWVKWVARMEPG